MRNVEFRTRHRHRWLGARACSVLRHLRPQAELRRHPHAGLSRRTERGHHRGRREHLRPDGSQRRRPSPAARRAGRPRPRRAHRVAARPAGGDDSHPAGTASGCMDRRAGDGDRLGDGRCVARSGRRSGRGRSTGGPADAPRRGCGAGVGGGRQAHRCRRVGERRRRPRPVTPRLAVHEPVAGRPAAPHGPPCSNTSTWCCALSRSCRRSLTFRTASGAIG